MVMSQLRPLQDLDPARFETPEVLRALALASRSLAELKGLSRSIPNQGIIINTLGIQEAKDSSEIENIVTTHDELYKEDSFPDHVRSAATKEVYRYREALRLGLSMVASDGIITINHLVAIQSELLRSATGIRTMPGTNLVNSDGRVVYEPPQDHAEILGLLHDLEKFIHVEELFAADPLVKMSLLHHQFESIHPFYDGNGRTGRILNVLYLVKENLLEIPVLYLSRPLVRNKAEYYRRLQAVRETDEWENWVIFMLRAVEESARDAVRVTGLIGGAFLAIKHQVRSEFKFYSHDLVNTLFSHPYTKVEFLVQDLGVTRLTATRYLEELTRLGILQKHRSGKSNYYVNKALMKILAGAAMRSPAEPPSTTDSIGP